MTHLLKLKYSDNSEKKWNLLLEYYTMCIFITHKYSFHPIMFYMPPHDMPAYLFRVLFCVLNCICKVSNEEK